MLACWDQEWQQIQTGNYLNKENAPREVRNQIHIVNVEIKVESSMGALWVQSWALRTCPLGSVFSPCDQEILLRVQWKAVSSG